MAKSTYFAQMFKIAQENDTQATELPVVLKVAVEPAEGGASQDVAADPAVTEAPAADASAAAEPAAAEGQNDDGGAPVDAPAAAETPAVAAPAEETTVDGAPEAAASNAVADAEAETELAAAETADAQEGIAEANNEIANAEDEIETAQDVVDTTEAQVAAQKELLQKPEEVTASTVALATQSFRSQLARLKIDNSVAPSITQVTFESLLSKENGGAGLSPASALNVLTVDMEGFVESAKKIISKIWEAIKSALNKIVEFIKKIFGVNKRKLESQQSKINTYSRPSGQLTYSKVFPALKELNKVEDVVTVGTNQLALVKTVIDVSNMYVKQADVAPLKSAAELAAKAGFQSVLKDKAAVAIGKNFVIVAGNGLTSTKKAIEADDSLKAPYLNGDALNRLITDALKVNASNPVNSLKQLISNADAAQKKAEQDAGNKDKFQPLAGFYRSTVNFIGQAMASYQSGVIALVDAHLSGKSESGEAKKGDAKADTKAEAPKQEAKAEEKK